MTSRSTSIQYFLKNSAAVLFGNYDLAKRLQIAADLDKATNHLFSGDPAILPIPDDAPAEIPRIMLAAKDKKWRCNVSPDRLEFIYDEPDQPREELNTIKEQYLTVLHSLAECAKNELKASVHRLGLIVTNFALPEEPVKLIERTFIREGVLFGPRQLEIHILNMTTIGNLEVNKWCRIFSRDVSYGDKRKTALFVIFDLNTLSDSDKPNEFSADAITAFYDIALAQVSDGIRTLFP